MDSRTPFQMFDEAYINASENLQHFIGTVKVEAATNPTVFLVIAYPTA